MQERYTTSSGKVEVEAVRAAVVTLPDDSLMVVLNGGGQNVLIAPIGKEAENTQAVKAWRALRADYEGATNGRGMPLEGETGVLKALCAAVEYVRTCPSQPTKYTEEEGIRNVKRGRPITARGEKQPFVFTRARITSWVHKARQAARERDTKAQEGILKKGIRRIYIEWESHQT